MNTWLIIGIALTYVALLFVLASIGEKRANKPKRPANRAIVYSLSLAIYCTSWTFFGTVGSAASVGWGFLPIFLGPILALLLFAPVLKKLVRVSKQQNITSIADFIASRYGKSQGLAALVSLIAVAVIVPYIALQLKGVAMAQDILTQPTAASSNGLLSDFPLYLAIAMALFGILFGTRRVNTNESHRGVIYAVAFESLVKLVAFVSVGVFVTFGLFDGFGDLFQQASANTDFSELFAHFPTSARFYSTLVMAMVAIVCLPRQFHTAVVENTDRNSINVARWLFPLYLTIFVIFVVPIAAAGLLIFDPAVTSPDRFVLAIPLSANANGLALFAFVGGFSASTSMVIVATIALSTMVCNDLVMPLLMRWRRLHLTQRANLSGLLLGIRRSVIVVLLAAAYLYYYYLGNLEMLASIGLLSFAGVLQFAPAIFGGLYIRRISRLGVIAGLCSGFAVWAYTLLLPILVHAGLFTNQLLVSGPFSITALNPQQLLGWSLGDHISHGVFWSLAANISVTLLVSVFTSRSLIERSQALAFVSPDGQRGVGHLPAVPGNASQGELQSLLGRFLGLESARQAFTEYFERHTLTASSAAPADDRLLAYCERLLAGAVGGASARLLLESTLRRKELAIDDVVDIIDRSAEAVQFNRSLLQAALDNLSQGVSVIDSNQRLVAWNQRYLTLFDYPDGMIRLGRPIADLIRHNAEAGACGPGEVEAQVQRRLMHMRSGSSHVFRRTWPNGKVLEMHGNPMPGGGFVTTFNDISEHVHNQLALKEANETLENRVTERTQALSAANAELRHDNEVRARLEEAARKAQDEAERANNSKTRFLAAAGHDLMQPLSAARLFASTLRQQGDNIDETAANIEEALTSADGLLAGLLDISKLDAGKLTASPADFAISDLLQSLTTEFQALAAQRGLAFHYVPCHAVVLSDRQLLGRMLQNFLANAVRYTRQGRILFGCRRLANALRIEVWDTGPGIPATERRNIFEEFHRLEKLAPSENQGLGLGLSIAERMAKLLQHRIDLRSWPGHGTVFSVTVPLGDASKITQNLSEKRADSFNQLRYLRVLCVDDDAQIRQSLAALLTSWECEVVLACGRDELPDSPPDMLLADYQLHREADGLALIAELRQRWDSQLPAILMTANREKSLEEATRQLQAGLLRKPIKPAALRARMQQLLQAQRDI